MTNREWPDWVRHRMRDWWLIVHPATYWRLALALAFLVVVGVYLSPRDRSFLVTASTRGAVITTDGTAMNTWQLPTATICFRREQVDRTIATTGPNVPCDPRLYEILDKRDLEFAWATGTTIQLGRAGSEGGFSVYVKDTRAKPTLVDGRELREGSWLYVAPTAWQSGMILTFAGRATIGEVPAPGARLTLIDGDYEIREPTALLARPQSVARGNLLSGDSAEISTSDGQPLIVYGFVDARDPGLAGVHLTIYSPPADSYLGISRFAAETVRVEPTWIDRALSDTILTALIAFLSLVSAGAAVGTSLRHVVVRRDGGLKAQARSPADSQVAAIEAKSRENPEGNRPDTGLVDHMRETTSIRTKRRTKPRS